jgi:PAS domain S-box-containing protein
LNTFNEQSVNHLTPERVLPVGGSDSSAEGGQDRATGRNLNRPAAFKDMPISRKVTAVIMSTSVTVLLLTAAAFIIYDFITYQQLMVRNLSTTAAVIAGQSGRAIAAQDRQQALSLLGSLRADPNVESAAIYDSEGRLFASYPSQNPPGSFPARPEAPGHAFKHGHLFLVQTVTQQNRALGTLYVASAVRPLFARLRLYGGIALLVLFGSVLVALALSHALQRRITQPILALASVARTVSERGDFSVRAAKSGNDELGLLTEAFNQMLISIQQAEAARSFLAAIVESSDAAIVGKDLKGTVVSWNAGAERMFGYTPAEIIGQPITRIIAQDRPNEEPRLLQEIQQDAIRYYETVRIRKDGKPINVSLIASPVKNRDGKIIGISSIARDVTEWKRAEQQVAESRAQLSNIINSAMDAIITVDAEQRIQLFNAAAETMFRCERGDAIGQPLDRFIPESLRGAHREHVNRFGATGETGRTMAHLRPLSGVRADGQQFPIEASISQTEFNGQKLYTVILRDITERQRAEQLLERQTEKLQEQTEQIGRMNLELERRVTERTAELTAANHELEAFTYSVAHDLRAPLRHIDAFSKILHEEYTGVLPPDGQRYLQSIRNSSQHMSRLVDDLLNLARVGRQELKRQPTSLDGLVAEVVPEFKEEIKGRQIDWHIQPLPTVECDAGLMRVVFVNLLSNALKYTRPRAVSRIEIGSIEVNGTTAVYVRDNGVGFNMKYADKLFRVFQRLHRADDFEGTGVGLATVDRIMQKHGGSVWAEAAVDKGAVFYVTVMPVT